MIGTNRTDPTTRLTIGKRLSEQVEFTVSQNLRENGKATFVVSYFPRRNIELRALSRDSGTVSLGVRHQVTFGGGERASRRRNAASGRWSARSRFVDVEPAIEAQARAEIKLDRATSSISSSCSTTSIGSARRSTSRASSKRASAPGAIESDDARSVALEFRVNRGPRTDPRVRGLRARRRA